MEDGDDRSEKRPNALGGEFRVGISAAVWRHTPWKTNQSSLIRGNNPETTAINENKPRVIIAHSPSSFHFIVQ